MEYRVKIGRPRVKIDLARVKELLSQEDSIKAVAEKMNINYITLWRRIDEDRRNKKSTDNNKGDNNEIQSNISARNIRENS